MRPTVLYRVDEFVCLLYQVPVEVLDAIEIVFFGRATICLLLC